MMKNIGIILLLGTLFFACNNTSTKPEVSDRQKLRDTVMDIHNEMMPPYFSAQKVMDELEGKLKDASLNLTDQQKTDYATAHARLGSAVKAMKNWMDEWKEPGESETNEAAMLYLNDQKKKVDVMKQIMEQNFEAAHQYYDFKLNEK